MPANNVLVALGATVFGLLAAQAEFVYVDDFEFNRAELNGQNGWISSGAGIIEEPGNGPNLVAAWMNGSGERGSFLPVTVPDGQRGTLFFRMRIGTDNADPSTPVLDWSVGMSDVELTSAPGTSDDFESQLNQDRDASNLEPQRLRIRDGADFSAVYTMQPGTWYNAWLVIDNALDVSRLYLQGGALSEPTLLVDDDGQADFAFRNSTNGPVAQDLVRFFVRLGPTHSGALYLDDLWIDATGGENLANPSALPAPPKVRALVPAFNAQFHSAAAGLRFNAVADPSTTLAENGIELTLNGTNVTEFLTITQGEFETSVEYSGLVTNRQYRGSITLRDAAGRSRTLNVGFDTYSDATSVAIESEDYNFGRGQFINNPPPSGRNPEGGLVNEGLGYFQTAGAQGTDYSETSTTVGDVANNAYRPADPVTTQATGDARRAKYQALNVSDFQVSRLVPGEWLNYTRTLNGTYEVQLRYAASAATRLLLDKVTNGASTGQQTTRRLGTFLIAPTPTASTFTYSPLVDVLGRPLILSFAGVETLRLTAAVANNDAALNYLLLVSSEAPRLPTVVSAFPAPNATNVLLDAPIEIQLIDGSQPIDPASVKLFLDGVAVEPQLVDDDGFFIVAYQPPQIFEPGSTHRVRIEYADLATEPHGRSDEWSFTAADIPTVPPSFATPVTSVEGSERGLAIRVHKATNGAPDELFPATLARAEAQLSGGLIDPATNEPFPNEAAGDDEGRYVEPQQINYQEIAAPEGWFHAGTGRNDRLFPGVDPAALQITDPNHIALEALTYLELSAGLHRFGVRSDDGFRVTTGPAAPATSLLLGEYDGARGAGGTNTAIVPPIRTVDGGSSLGASEFEFQVVEAGVYAFRLLWVEGTGGASLEWYSVDRATGERTLINDMESASAVKAYQSRIGDGSDGEDPLPVTVMVGLTEQSLVMLTFLSQTNMTHRVQYRAEVEAGDWVDLTSVPGDGTPKSVTDSPTEAARFYRVTTER